MKNMIKNYIRVILLGWPEMPGEGRLPNGHLLKQEIVV